MSLPCFKTVFFMFKLYSIKFEALHNLAPIYLSGHVSHFSFHTPDYVLFTQQVYAFHLYIFILLFTVIYILE